MAGQSQAEVTGCPAASARLKLQTSAKLANSGHAALVLALLEARCSIVITFRPIA
jgi:hypothetical protein